MRIPLEARVTRRKTLRILCAGLGVAAIPLRGATAQEDNRVLLKRLETLACGTPLSGNESQCLSRIERCIADERFVVPSLQEHPWAAKPGEILGAAEGQAPVSLYFVSMRAGAVLPLHNHIGHLSKVHVLSGTFRVERFRRDIDDGALNLTAVDEAVISQNESSDVTSDVGFHRITAISDATFVDVMSISGPRAGSLRVECADASLRNCSFRR